MAAPSLRAWSTPGPDSFAKRKMLYRGRWVLHRAFTGACIALRALELALNTPNPDAAGYL